jgi:hypothetical protein
MGGGAIVVDSLQTACPNRLQFIAQISYNAIAAILPGRLNVSVLPPSSLNKLLADCFLATATSLLSSLPLERMSVQK